MLKLFDYEALNRPDKILAYDVLKITFCWIIKTNMPLLFIRVFLIKALQYWWNIITENGNLLCDSYCYRIVISETCSNVAIRYR
jgi:hypothetical protein